MPRIKGDVVVIDVRLPRRLLEEFDDWWKSEGLLVGLRRFVRRLERS